MDTKVTKEQLKKVLAEHPEQFCMHTWGVETSCGTAYCLAGWTLVLAGYKTQLHGKYVEFLREDGTLIDLPAQEAAKVLGVDNIKLFYIHLWPYSVRHMKNETLEQYTNQACAAIDYFMPAK